MEELLHKLSRSVLLLALTLGSGFSASSDCFSNHCNDKRPCVTVGCKRSGLQTICEISSTYGSSPADLKPKCVSPYLVPGLPELCNEVLKNTTAVPGVPKPDNIQKETTTTEEGTAENKSSKVSENGCYGTAILLSVAVGSFAAGSFLAGVIACCCRYCRGSNKNTEQEDVPPHNLVRWLPVARTREMGSTSSAQLLANASVDTNSTHNTLQSTNDGSSPNGFQARYFSESNLERFPAFSNPQQSSLPWSDAGYLPRQRPSFKPRNRSAEWLEAKGNYFQTAVTLPRNWNERGLPPLSQTRTLPTPVMETIYSPPSESSSRDYQSIQGGSENPYAPCSESSSDYSAPQAHRVLVIRDGEIYQPSSESGSSGNDYTSLKGQRVSLRRKDGIYYPTSEGSNKDYATLTEDGGDTENLGACGVDFTRSNTNSEHAGDLRQSRKKFNVNSFEMPTLASNTGRNNGLQDISEYEIVGNTGEAAVRNNETLADMHDKVYRAKSSVKPHEYYTVEPHERIKK